MKIIKRDGRVVDFDYKRVINAIERAMSETKSGVDCSLSNDITRQLEEIISSKADNTYNVEEIQDLIEEFLMKSNRCDVAKKYILYREMRNNLRKSPMWEMTDLQKAIWENKYRVNNETFGDFLDRISNGKEDVKKVILNKKFLPAGRILAGRGTNVNGKKVTLSNCFVLAPPEDNIESIFDTARDMARTYSWGGGVGIDISNLRPANAKVNNSALQTTGAISFMDLYSMTTGLIGQHNRRGALMISMDCHHPDIIDFIKLKTDLDKVTKANISVMVTDDFFNAVLNDEMWEMKFNVVDTNEVITKTEKASEVFKLLAKCNWGYAEPGILYWDNITNWNLLSEDKEFKYVGVNPCFTGDMKLLTTEGYKTFEELNDTNPSIVNINGDTSLSKVWCSGEKETVKLTLSNGKEITCTPDHRFMTIDGDECEAKNLKNIKIKSYNNEEVYVKDIEPNGVHKVYDFTEPLTHWGVVEGFIVHNCAEEPLPPYGSCNLCSINLSEFVINPFEDNARFDYDKFNEAVKLSVNYMNDILDEAIENNMYPLDKQKQMVEDYRQIGIGVMGISDMLIKLKIRYGSKESLEICDKIGFEMINSALQQSSLLAKEYGSYTKFNKDAILESPFLKYNAYLETLEMIDKYGLRNSQLLTIAPTGSISTMLGVSGGIEPIYNYSYTRKTESIHDEDVYYKVFTDIVLEYINKFGLEDDSNLPDYFTNAMILNPFERIDMQSVWQTHIDASISSTLNLPFATSVSQVEALYLYAWEKKLKGMTIFRDGCQRGGILTNDKETKQETIKGVRCPECDSESMIKANGCELCTNCGYSPCGV